MSSSESEIPARRLLAERTGQRLLHRLVALRRASAAPWVPRRQRFRRLESDAGSALQRSPREPVQPASPPALDWVARAARGKFLPGAAVLPVDTARRRSRRRWPTAIQNTGLCSSGTSSERSGDALVKCREERRVSRISCSSSPRGAVECSGCETEGRDFSSTSTQASGTAGPSSCLQAAIAHRWRAQRRRVPTQTAMRLAWHFPQTSPPRTLPCVRRTRGRARGGGKGLDVASPHPNLPPQAGEGANTSANAELLLPPRQSRGLSAMVTGEAP